MPSAAIIPGPGPRPHAFIEKLRWQAHAWTLALQRSHRSIWIIAGNRTALLSAEPLLQLFRHHYPSHRLQIFTCTVPDLHWALVRYPNDGVLPLPAPRRLLGRRLAAALQPRLVVEVGTRLPEALRPPGVPIRSWPGPRTAPACPFCDPESLPPLRGPDFFRPILGWPEATPVLAAPLVPGHRLQQVLERWLTLRRLEPGTRLILEPAGPDAAPPPLPDGIRLGRRSAPGKAPGECDLLWADVPGEFPFLAEAAGAVWVPDTPDFHPAIPAALGCRLWFDSPAGDPPWVRGGFGRVLDGARHEELLDDLRVSPAGRAVRRRQVLAWLEPARGTTLAEARPVTALLGPPETGRRRRQSWEIPKGFRWLAGIQPGHWLARIKHRPQPRTWEGLREQLRRPRSILVLGNGPSSEHPAITDTTHDLLFRVNWRWKNQPLHDRPDLVFVGDPHTIEHLPGFRFVVDDPFHWRILALRDLCRAPLEPFDCLCLADLPALPDEPPPQALPSGGAYLVRLAVGLAPQHLTLAGIDLFADARGRYPGDLRTVNDYAAVHRREDEVHCIVTALRHFNGTLHVIGAPLQQALTDHGIRFSKP